MERKKSAELHLQHHLTMKPILKSSSLWLDMLHLILLCVSLRLGIAQVPGTSCLKNLKITIACPECKTQSAMGSSIISGAIWKFLKIALPVKLAEQWNLILFYWYYKRIVLELIYVSDTSQFLPKLYKYHWWTPETHIYILYQGRNLQYSAISPRKKVQFFALQPHI